MFSRLLASLRASFSVPFLFFRTMVVPYPRAVRLMGWYRPFWFILCSVYSFPFRPQHEYLFPYLVPLGFHFPPCLHNLGPWIFLALTRLHFYFCCAPVFLERSNGSRNIFFHFFPGTRWTTLLLSETFFHQTSLRALCSTPRLTFPTTPTFSLFD